MIIISWAEEMGLVAQLVERCLCKAEALGPNPSKSIENNAHIEADSMWKGKGPFFRKRNGPTKPCTSFATRRSLSSVGHKLLMPARGWLGSSADEGRAKLR